MATLTAPQVLPPAVDVSAEERDRLLEVARAAVTAAARGEPELELEVDAHCAPDDERCGGAFVTLFHRGALRGCIGNLDPSRALIESVALAADGATRHDPRFRRVTEAELPDIEIQVSVLGPFVALEDPLAFRLGTDGLCVARGYSRGLLLPEVATEHQLDARSMLEATCLKAGLARSAWHDHGTAVFAFRTERFGGPAIAA